MEFTHFFRGTLPCALISSLWSTFCTFKEGQETERLFTCFHFVIFSHKQLQIWGPMIIKKKNKDNQNKRIFRTGDKEELEAGTTSPRGVQLKGGADTQLQTGRKRVPMNCTCFPTGLTLPSKQSVGGHTST